MKRKKIREENFLKLVLDQRYKNKETKHNKSGNVFTKQ